MERRFLTYAELMELYLMKFDAAVVEMRRVLADTDPNAIVYSADIENLQQVIELVNSVKSVQVSVMEQ